MEIKSDYENLVNKNNFDRLFYNACIIIEMFDKFKIYLQERNINNSELIFYHPVFKSVDSFKKYMIGLSKE